MADSQASDRDQAVLLEGYPGSRAGSRLFDGLRRTRTHWGLIDQGIASLTNLVPSVLVARSVDEREFSVFAATFTAGLILTGLGRALIGEPQLIRAEGLRRRAPSAFREPLASALALGLTAGLLGLVAAVVVRDPALRGSILAFALVIPGVLLQDAARYAYFAQMRHREASINDAAWLLAILLAFGLWSSSGGTVSASSGIALWGGTGWLVAILAMFGLQARPTTSPIRFVRDTASLGRHFALQYMALAGASQAALYLLGFVVTLEALGAVRGAQLLFGPMNVIYLGAFVTLVPAGLPRERERFRGWLLVASAALSTLVVLCTLTWLLVPDPLGEALLGDTWGSASALVLPYGLYMLGVTAATGPSVGLTVLERTRVLTALRLGTVPLILLVPLGAAGLWDAHGYVLGLAAVGAVMASIWWVVLWRVVASESQLQDSAPIRSAGDRREGEVG